MKLYELAKMIRSKNAGPFVLTIDILFENDAAYSKAVNSGMLTRERISQIYNVSADTVDVYTLPMAKAVKFSFPRPAASGSFEDYDVYGAQFHGPIVMLEVPE